MSIIGGFHVHRKQITFDYVDTDTGRVERGQIRPADRAHLAAWLVQRFAGVGQVEFSGSPGTDVGRMVRSWPSELLPDKQIGDTPGGLRDGHGARL
jgi:hypothetical protein